MSECDQYLYAQFIHHCQEIYQLYITSYINASNQDSAQRTGAITTGQFPSSNVDDVHTTLNMSHTCKVGLLSLSTDAQVVYAGTMRWVTSPSRTRYRW